MVYKIFRSILTASASILLSCLVIITVILYRDISEEQHTQLGNQIVLAADAVEKNGLGYLTALRLRDSRITWIAADGTVLFDSDADAETMENHAGREEVQQALDSGTGRSSRRSSTLLEETLYLAHRLDDGTVLRMSITSDTVFSLALGMIQPIAFVSIFGIFFSVFLARRMARRIVEPLNRLDLDEPLENDTYEELSPLLNRISQQHRQIEHQLSELTRRIEEFSFITKAMREGLVLLDASRKVLSINPAAMAIFDADEGCLGRDILHIDRSRKLHERVMSALKSGHDQIRLPRCGRTYQFEITRLGREGSIEGLAILAFDVTEQAENERLRREFSANVSHELKTPLQTIIGSAELLEDGLVAPEDVRRFSGNMRREALRLVTLIEDIIRLSRLEEDDDLPATSFDMLDVLTESVSDFHDAATAREITISLKGDPVRLYSIRPLVKEIITNLCDNAVKYNVEGGSVDIILSESPDKVIVSVSDSGIGIAEEEQARIFERFYRVDKSHSRTIGGTGLGLSIVKHAARRIGADIALESAPGKGSVFTVSFHQN